MSLNNTKVKLSSVIATLGGDSLEHTIKSLNSGTIVPDEILICIPEEYSGNINFSLPSNTFILKTDVKGQVAQRCCGFTNAKFDYVLQLDDDIIFDKDCVRNLIVEMEKLGDKSSVAPMFYTNQDKKFAYNPPGKRDRYLAFWANGRDGYQAGHISKSGLNFGFIQNESHLPIKVDWLPGGCVLHHRHNLILKPFYPYKGKAFAEDLFHSMHLRKNGIKLYLIPNAKIYFEWIVDPSNSLIKEISLFWKSSKALLRFAKEDNRNRLMLFMYLLNSFITAPFKKWIG